MHELVTCIIFLSNWQIFAVFFLQLFYHMNNLVNSGCRFWTTTYSRNCLLQPSSPCLKIHQPAPPPPLHPGQGGWIKCVSQVVRSTCLLYFLGPDQKQAKVSTRARAETSGHLDTIINLSTSEHSIESDSRYCLCLTVNEILFFSSPRFNLSAAECKG